MIYEDHILLNFRVGIIFSYVSHCWDYTERNEYTDVFQKLLGDFDDFNLPLPGLPGNVGHKLFLPTSVSVNFIYEQLILLTPLNIFAYVFLPFCFYHPN